MGLAIPGVVDPDLKVGWSLLPMAGLSGFEIGPYPAKEA